MKKINYKHTLSFMAIELLVYIFMPLTLLTQDKLLEIEKRPQRNFFEIRDAMEEYWQNIPENERRGWKQYKRWEWFWETRVNEDGTFADALKIYKEWINFNSKFHSDKLASEVKWTQLGPFNPPIASNVGAYGIGRVNVIRFHPDNSNIIYAGAAGGGLWKSTNEGKTWSVFPFTEFLSLGVSDIGISESNPNIIYVSTGDADGSGAVLATNSIGVIKTTNGGATWEVTNLRYNLSEGKLFGRILVDPENPDIVLVATSDGIFKSNDGGSTWKNKIINSFVDMEFNPYNSKIIYASTRNYTSNEIYKSTDQGDTWTQVNSVLGSRRIALAVTYADGKYVYALVANSSRSFHSLLRSTDEGKTWKTMSSGSPNILGRDWGADNSGQGEYDLAITVSPGDKDEVYVGGINIWKSSNGGVNWEQKTHWYGGNQKAFVHADIHDLAFDLNTGYLFACHDGGIDISIDGGKVWKSLSSSLSITQYYRLGVSAKEPYIIFGGSQDNGTSYLKDGKWYNAYGGDGMECIVDYNDPKKVYVSLYYGYFKRSTDGGESFSDMIDPMLTQENGAWVAPLVISPQNPAILYAGYTNIWKHTNYGIGRNNWKKISNFSGSTLRSIAVAPTDENTIYAATYNKLYVTYNGGTQWKDISPGTSSITYIAVDPFDNKRIWVSISGFDSKNKVLEFDGNSWTNLTGNLPNVPVNTIVYQKNSPDRLYIGTDIGVFYSDYGSAYWELYGTGLPNLVVTELEIHYGIKKIRAATFGRGIWEADLINCNLPEPQIRVNGDIKFCQGDSVILTADLDGVDYQWSTGEKTKNIVVKESGTYNLIVRDANGCKSRSKPITVNVIAVPTISVKPGSGYPVCEGDEIYVELSASLGFKSYLWSNGATERKITITKLGKYYVTGTTSDGCNSRSEIFELKINPNPPKPTITQYGSTLQASEGAAYQWYFNNQLIMGAKSRTLQITEPGYYSVEVFNEIGCSSISDAKNIISSVDEKFDFEKIIVNPNPATDRLNIRINDFMSNKILLQIFNILGERLIESSFYISGNLNFDFDISVIAKGAYILKIIDNNNTHIIKFIKD